MTGGGRYRQPFFPLSVNNSFSMKETRKNYITVTLGIFGFYMCPQIFITIRPISKKKIGSRVHDDRSY